MNKYKVINSKVEVKESIVFESHNSFQQHYFPFKTKCEDDCPLCKRKKMMNLIGGQYE